MATPKSVLGNFDDVTFEDLVRLRRDPVDAIRHHRVSLFLDARASGVSSEYLFYGFALADRFDPHHEFSEAEHCDDFHIDGPERLLSTVTAGDTAWPTARFALTLWKGLALLPGLGHMLDVIDWTRVPSGSAITFVDALLELLTDEEDDDDRRDRWAIIAPNVPDLFETYASIEDEYRPKFCDAIDVYHWYWGDADESARILPTMYRLTERLCRPPYSRKSGVEDPLSRLVYEPDEQVVYARDQNGAIVGRQLLAISTVSTLLFFSV